eukprot:c25059_g1_i3 orf=1096-4158(-)
MTVAWPLPCDVVNDPSSNNLLIIAREFHYCSKVPRSGFLTDSDTSASKHVKDLFGPTTAGDIDPAPPAPMADSNPHQDCNFNDSAADDGRSYSNTINACLKENSLHIQSDSHFSGDVNPKAGKEETVLEPAVANVGKSYPSLQLAGGNAFVNVVDTGVQRHFKDADNHLVAVNMSRRTDTSSSGCSERNSSVSLRAWLSNSARVVDKVENLHIFKQIAEFVDLAHSQGVVLRNVRPSSFLLSSLSRVSIIESASSGTSSGSSAESTGRVTAAGLVDAKLDGPSSLKSIARDSASAQLMDFEMQNELATDIPVGKWRETEFDNKRTSSGHGSADGTRQEFQLGKEKYDTEEQGGRSFTSSSSDHAGDQVNDKKFPLKEMLSLEMMWYKSPEDINGGTPDFPSDVYSLGVLFLELFYSCGSQGEWSRAMSDIRHRLLPPSLLLEHAQEAAFCLLLLHPDPNSRPKAREILHSDVFNEIEDKLVEREAIMNLEEKLSEAETTLDFLLQMQQKKHVFIQKLAQELNSLNEDIKEVERWQALLMKNRRWIDSFSINSIRLVESHKSAIGLLSNQSFANKEVTASGYCKDGLGSRRQELLLAKSAQLMRSFTYLRESYLSIIKSDHHSGSGLKSDISRQSGPGQGSGAEKISTSRFLNKFTSSKVDQSDSGGQLGCFFDDFCKFMKYSSFDVKATLQYGDILNTKNMVCSLSFDCDAEFFATAGVSRRVKIFDCNALLEESNDMHYPVFEMNSMKKLSCVCWNNFRKNHLASSDLEGAIQLWDVTTARTIMELKEHGRCAWSVDFSHSDSTKLASGSDDCCVKLWSTNQCASVGTIRTKANICTVQFSPDHSHMLAFGSADSQVYFHDLRYIRIPVCILTGHQKAVSFIRFAGPGGIVSASTDNTLKLWDLSKTNTNVRGYGARLGSRSDCITTYSGHTNVKNFVGLSVAEESYIACGSETNEVFVYHKSLPVAMLSHKFKNADPISGQELDDVGDQFVSSVCWRKKSQVLVTANSVGNIQVLEMV